MLSFELMHCTEFIVLLTLLTSVLFMMNKSICAFFPVCQFMNRVKTETETFFFLNLTVK